MQCSYSWFVPMWLECAGHCTSSCRHVASQQSPACYLNMQVHTFNIGIYPGAILPFIIGYWADAATAVGDITATEEASGIEQIGPRHDERIQGCLLADGMPSDFCA